MSAQKWTRKGNPLAIEPNPNTTPPAAGSTLGPMPRPPTGTEMLWLALLDGTSLAVQLWVDVTGAGVWVKVGAPVALLARESAQVVVPSGVTIFPQVTAAAGNPTMLAAGTVSA